MYRNIIAAGLITLGLGGAAIAQTSTNPNSFQPPGDWNATIAGAMFSDVTTGAVRTPEEITSNFMALSPEDQNAVREYCKRYSDSSAAATTDTKAGPSGSANDVAPREACATAGKL